MTTDSAPGPTVQRISGPGELLQAVPYLLGFHPRTSLVLVGLDAGRLVMTARLDLADAEHPAVLAETVDALWRGGARQLIGAIYDDAAGVDALAGSLPRSDLAAAVGHEVIQAGCDIVDVLLVAAGRWWSFTCAAPQCCPPEGRLLPDEPSSFTAAATYAGMVALPDREALAAVLDPLPEPSRAALDQAIATAEDAAMAAVLSGLGTRHERAVKRAVFAAARASAEPGWAGPPDEEAARFGAALAALPVRDAVWMAVDDGRLDGRPLWLDLARRMPAPYDATPLFLFGWASWRAGEGALAGIAAERAIDSDAAYTAADLLLAALARGVDPRRFPRLRLPRSA